MPAKGKAPTLVSVITIISLVVVPIVTFVVGTIVNGYSFASNVATRPWVESGLEANRKYTDDKSAQALKDAIDHSDRSHDDMVMRLNEQASEMKSQGVKIDYIYDSIKELKESKKNK